MNCPVCSMQIIDEAAFCHRCGAKRLEPTPRERLQGAIGILSSDQSHPTLELPGIENVQAVASLIDETRRQERRRRGLYVESV